MSRLTKPETTSNRKLLAEWFWTDRWIGSSAFLLPIGPRGLYREMLTAAWRRGARLPNDHEAIRRAVGCTPQEWKRCWPRIQRFWRVDGEHLVNDTQLEVYADALRAQQEASDRAAKAAAARWRKGTGRNARASTDAHAQASPGASPQAVLEQCPPSLSPDYLSERSPRDTRARGAGNRNGVGAGSFPGDHMDHLVCGPVCFTPRMTAKFIGRFGHDREELTAWAKRVCQRETARVEAGQQPTFGDDFDYWTAAYDADFGQPKGVPAVARTVPNADQTSHFLAELRAARG